MDEQETPAADLLEGAGEIAAYLGKSSREVYGFPKSVRKRLGLFHIGRKLHGSRAKIRKGLEEMAEAGK